ncbi:sigma-70 family RNA polymerase sigma factor [Chryseobacterium sp. A321]
MRPLDQLTDTQIISRVLQGETKLYELIVRRFNPYLYKVGRSYNFGHEDTEDLMQDTFVDAYRNLAHFEERSNFKTWLIRIMLNNCYHKKEKASFRYEHSGVQITDKMQPMFETMDLDTNKQINNRELGFLIESSLEKIPQEYRMVFSLREINGFNVEETSEILHISPSNVKTRLSRAKSMLRKQFEKAYSPLDLYEFNLIYCDGIVRRVMEEIGIESSSINPI